MKILYIFSIAFAVIFSYFLGSLNSSIIVVRLWKKVDIRDFGSKNAGLTNTLRVFGKGPALATLLCDLAKGVIAVSVSRLFASAIGSFDDTMIIGYIAGAFAMVGHIFPVYYNFKGGKAVLVAATTLLAIDPVTFSIVIPFFALILLVTRYVSVSSIIAAVAYPIFTFITQSLR
ncbi:MAG: glycerol-3-phosphate acyltransferase, partial [Oscillospiraceae bacterium]